METVKPITVLGAGSWGTALALLLARNHQQVRLWDHDSQHMARLSAQGSNQEYLPDIKFPENLVIFSELSAALTDVQDILVVVPSNAFREVLQKIKPLLNSKIRIAWGTKGLDPQSSKLLHEVVEEIFGKKIPMALVAGPNFAKEVALDLPTATTLANNNSTFANDLLQRLRNPNFRVYVSEDMIGAEVCGAVKNVLAIAVGASDGLKLGANARCALITRGLAEMARLGTAVGGKRETFMGLAGMGDLVLTTTDDQSRNRRFGLALGAGQDLEKTKKQIGQVVEGMTNAKQVYELAKKHRVDMPICEQVYRVIYENLPITEAVKILLSRDPRSE